MPRVAPIQTVFNGGEFSPLMEGRVDFATYPHALKTSLNGVGLIQGGWTRRPGTVFIKETKTSTKKSRLVKFEFSTIQAYILEFGDLYIRFYKDRGQIVDGGGLPIEVTTPYTQTELSQLKFIQSADVLYIAHPNHEPRKLLRFSHTSWSLVTISFTDGPYLTANGTTTTLTSSATSGTATVTASAITGINSDTGFQSTDVGRLIRLRTTTANWGYGTITAVTSTTVCTVSWTKAIGATTATDNWRLGRWSDTTGYPVAVGFYQDRLAWGDGQTLSFSVTSNFEDHSPSDLDGTITNSAGMTITVNSGDVQVIRWFMNDPKGFLVGTVSGEWLIEPSTTTSGFSPTNFKASQIGSNGSADIQSVHIGAATVYFQRLALKLRELAFVFSLDGFQTPDLTILSEHITKGGVTDMAYQPSPFSILWVVRADGTLLALTDDRPQKVVAWTRNVLGGTSDAAGTQAKVESVAIIPSPDETSDEVWMIVQRYVNGATKRYIEYLSPFWKRGDLQTNAFFLDSGLTYNGAPVTSVTGLDHLEGETVSILADGAAHPNKVVTSGAVTLDRSASVVHVGYSYNSDGQTLRNNAGSADGTSQGKIQRKHRVTFRLLDTLGLQVGPNFTKLFTPTIRKSSDPADTAVPLFTGDLEVPWEGGYSTEDLIAWRISQPFPATLLAIMPQQITQDR